jgi:hypothetical protein
MRMFKLRRKGSASRGTQLFGLVFECVPRACSKPIFCHTNSCRRSWLTVTRFVFRGAFRSTASVSIHGDAAACERLINRSVSADIGWSRCIWCAVSHEGCASVQPRAMSDWYTMHGATSDSHAWLLTKTKLRYTTPHASARMRDCRARINTCITAHYICSSHGVPFVRIRARLTQGLAAHQIGQGKLLHESSAHGTQRDQTEIVQEKMSPIL